VTKAYGDQGAFSEMLVGRNLKQDYLRLTQRAADTARLRGEDVAASTSVSLLRVLILAMRVRAFRAVFLYRMSRFFYLHKMRFISAVLDRLNHRLCFVEIACSADIGPGFSVTHPFGMAVGTRVKAGKNLSLAFNAAIGGNIGKQGPDGRTQPILGDNVIVGGGGKVFGPITIGDDVVVGANTMVTYDVPSGSVVGRMPSQIIKRDGRRVSLMEGPTELSRILRDCVSRLEALESAAGINRESAEGASTDDEAADC